jgi:hypothetical protein
LQHCRQSQQLPHAGASQATSQAEATVLVISGQQVGVSHAGAVHAKELEAPHAGPTGAPQAPQTDPADNIVGVAAQLQPCIDFNSAAEIGNPSSQAAHARCTEKIERRLIMESPGDDGLARRDVVWIS